VTSELTELHDSFVLVPQSVSSTVESSEFLLIRARLGTALKRAVFFRPFFEIISAMANKPTAPPQGAIGTAFVPGSVSAGASMAVPTLADLQRALDQVIAHRALGRPPPRTFTWSFRMAVADTAAGRLLLDQFHKVLVKSVS